jgi:hypothetical protein
MSPARHLTHAAVWLVCVATTVTAITGCRDAPVPVAPGGVTGSAAATEAETWLHRPTADERSKLQRSAPHFLVVEAKQLEALGELSSTPYAVLSIQDVHRLLGAGVIPEETSDTPVLLRCVQPAFGPMDHATADTLRVFWNDGTVLVEYLALRNQYMALRRFAVIALLPSEPREVYVDALAAIR